MTDINFKIRDGTITSEFITTIGKITLYQDVNEADKRQVQNHN